MISYSIKTIFLLLFMLSLDVTSFNHNNHLRTDSKNSKHVKDSYTSLLSSLIKINEDRVKALKKLHLLNDINFGKEFLRTSIENRLNNYDETLDNIMMILKLLVNPQHSHEPHQKVNHYKVTTGSKHDLDIVKKHKDVLRKFQDSEVNDKSSQEKRKRKSSESSDEELGEEVKNDINRNLTKGRSYYYEYGCGRGRVRCIKACKEAYRDACDEEYCEKDLRRSLRKACKRQCRDWFY